MGHMDDDNVEHFTITVRWRSDSTPEIFRRCTNVDTNGDDLTFDDENGKSHQFTGVSFHVAAE